MTLLFMATDQQTELHNHSTAYSQVHILPDPCAPVHDNSAHKPQ